MTKSKAILVKLSVDLAERVDQAAKELGVVRLEFIRESVRRNLRYFEQHERPVLRKLVKPVLDELRARAYR